MVTRPKVWTRLGALALAGTASVALLAGCGPKEDQQAQEGAAPAPTLAPDAITEAPHDAGPGDMSQMSGESEGAAAAADLGTDDIAYLSQLSYVRGHLRVGVELYRQGNAEMAETHMKHPSDELYAALEPAFAARGAEGFGSQMETLANLVAARASLDAVNEAYDATVAAIARAEAAGTDETTSDPKAMVKVIETVVRTAGDEYAQGVVDGKVVMGHEYQDAWGFTEIARERLAALPRSDANAAALVKVAEQLDTLKPAWPSVIPPETVTTDSTLLYGAAARIEIAGLEL